jgi:hypothetical protein
MLILFVHQNFPGQFRSLAPALVAAGHRVLSLSVNPSHGMPGIEHFQHQPARSSTVGIHPWVADLETKVIRGESAFRKALEMHARGIRPDLIVAHMDGARACFSSVYGQMPCWLSTASSTIRRMAPTSISILSLRAKMLVPLAA